MSPTFRGWVFACLFLAGAPAFAQNRVEGVNPADLLTQVQVSGEFNRLDDDSHRWSLAAKYDYRVAGSPMGLNVEFPLALGLDAGGLDATGHGDLFTRVRYIKSIGRWSVGGGFEVVVPLGSREFSGGRWQTNPSLLGVYAWSPSHISAIAHKRVFGYISDDSAKADLNQYQWRAIHVNILPTGWFRQFDLSHWQDVRTRADWLDVRASLGKQLSARSRAQVELKKLHGDQRNDWAVSVSYAVKL